MKLFTHHRTPIFGISSKSYNVLKTLERRMNHVSTKRPKSTSYFMKASRIQILVTYSQHMIMIQGRLHLRDLLVTCSEEIYTNNIGTQTSCQLTQIKCR